MLEGRMEAFFVELFRSRDSDICAEFVVFCLYS